MFCFNVVRIAIVALTLVVLGVVQSVADGTAPVPLQPGQVLGNNGTAPEPAAPVRAWQGVAQEHAFRLYASPAGNDANNSCSDSGSPCTLKGACRIRSRYNTFLANGSVAIKLADGTYSATDDNNALCSVIGNIGGSSTILTSIQGNCSSPTSVVLAVPENAAGVFVKDGGEAGINCLEFTGGDHAIGIENSGQSAVADYNNIYWGLWGTGGSHVAINSGGWVNLVAGGETLLADFNVHWNLSGNAVLNAGAPTRIPAALSWPHGAFVAASGPTVVDLGSWSVAGAGVASSTGAKGIFNGPGYLITPGNTPCGQTLPGDGGCTFRNGFQDGAGEGLAAGLRQNAQSSSYPAATTDCNGVITAGGGAFYSVTVGAASDYQRDCRLTITNTDLSSCKGKSIVASGLTKFILFPGQTVELMNVSDTWVQRGPGRWRPNCDGTPLIINTDSTNGSDAAGMSDGLGTGAEAFKSVNAALWFVNDNFDFAGRPQRQVKILMASGSTDSAIVHYSPHASDVGAGGGEALTIDGNGGSLTGGVQLYFGGTVVQLRNVTLSNASGSCLATSQGAYVLIRDLVTFGACSGSQMTLSVASTIEVLQNLDFSGGGTYQISNFGGYVIADGGAWTVSSNINYSGGVILGQAPSTTQLSAVRWSLGTNTVTGKKYEIEANHVLFGSANIPGTISGTTASGGQAL